MSRQYRVKRNYGKKATTYRAKPRMITILLVVLLFAGLGYMGTIIYEPVYDFVMSIGKPPEIDEPEPVIPEPEPEPEISAEPEPPPKPVYDKLRAVYVPHEIAADTAKLGEFLDTLQDTQINTVMIDIKNAQGDVLYKSKNEMAVKWGAVTSDAIDLKALAKTLQDKNLMLAAKMSVFRDPKAASAGRLTYAINYMNSDFLWLDNSAENGGKPWLNPYSIPAQDYIDSLVNETLEAGAKLIVLEDFQFPDNSGVYASFGKDAVSMSRSEILKAIIDDLAKHAEENSARLAVHYTASEVVQTEGQENRYGGPVLGIPREYLLLGARLSQFGNSYSANGLEITNALENPADAVKATINYAKQGVSSDTQVIPMLQGGNDTPFNSTQKYSGEQILSGIKAAEELGCDEYVLYNANGEYILK